VELNVVISQTNKEQGYHFFGKAPRTGILKMTFFAGLQEITTVKEIRNETQKLEADITELSHVLASMTV